MSLTWGLIMRRLQCALLTAVAVIGFASIASAADMPVKAPVVVPAFSWTGCYLGGSFGGIWGAKDITSDFPNTGGRIESQKISYSNATAGGYLGCNYQTGAWVWGIEGDANWARVNREGMVDIVNLDEFYRTTMNWYGSVRGRLGFASGLWHFYGTGGVAFSDQYVEFLNYTDATRTVLQEREGQKVKTGWTAGAGVERALSGNWIVRTEYLYYDFGTTRFTSAELAEARSRFHVVRLGLSYKF